MFYFGFFHIMSLFAGFFLGRSKSNMFSSILTCTIILFFFLFFLFYLFCLNLLGLSGKHKSWCLTSFFLLLDAFNRAVLLTLLHALDDFFVTGGRLFACFCSVIVIPFSFMIPF
jgi:Fe2+ transport system protein B